MYSLQGTVIGQRHHLLVLLIKTLFFDKVFCTTGEYFKYRNKINFISEKYKIVTNNKWVTESK